jgi:hypothetical protein
MTTTGRTILLRHTSEANFEAWVVREAERNGWHGHHVRQSLAVVQGVHTQRQHGHSDAHGQPDWLFWKDDEPLLFVELKSWEGKLSKDQQRVHGEFARTNPPTIVQLWGPQDEDVIRHTFRGKA